MRPLVWSSLHSVWSPVPPDVNPADLLRPTQAWVKGLARFGYTAQGLVYGILGILALQAAFASAKAPDGTRAAIKTIADQPFGKTLLMITALGLAAYVMWRIVQAVKDPDNRGDDAKGYAVRAGYAVSAVAYAVMAYTAATVALGIGVSGDSGERSAREWTAWAMSFPFGRWLIGTIGVIIGIVGIVHGVMVYNASFMREYNRAEMTPAKLKWVKWIGRFGLAARGVTFLIIGWFLVRAAWWHNAGEARGLGGALGKLAAQPYGRFLLAVIAAGFVSYGIYCITRARYRYFRLM